MVAQQADDSLDVCRVAEILRPFVSYERRCRIETALAQRTRQVVLVLENIANAQNASAVVRTADAMGLVDLHVIEKHQRFEVSQGIALGADKWLTLHRYHSGETAYAALRARGYQIWASTLRQDAIPVDALPIEQPTALVFGNEREGLTDASLWAADGRFRIPMRGFAESLNVSVAVAVATASVRARLDQAPRATGLSVAEIAHFRALWYRLSVRGAEQILRRHGLVEP